MRVSALLLWWLAAICASVSPAARASAESERELLDRTLGAHRSSRELIRTAACHVDFKLTLADGKVQTCSGQYWLGPEGVRAQFSDSVAGEVDYLWKDSVQKSVQRRQTEGSSYQFAQITASPSRFMHRGDAWARGLLVLNMPNEIQYVPAEQLVEAASAIKGVERKSIDGVMTILVRLYFDKNEKRSGAWTVEVAFDPAANYLVRKVVHIAHLSAGDQRREEAVQQFQEPAPGIYFPEVITTKSGNMSTGMTRLTNIKINQELPPGIFVFRYPEGITLMDTIRGTVYQVDAEGNRISTEKPVSRMPAPPQRADGSPVKTAVESRSEPPSWTAWILPAGVAVLLLGVGGLLLRRWRAKRMH